MKRLLLTVSFVLFTSMAFASAQSCYATLMRDTLRIGNTRIERTFSWNGGALRTLRLTDKATGHTMKSRHELPDFIFAKEAPEDAKLETITVPESRWAPACLIARVSYHIGQVELRREYRIYDEVPAIACDTYVRGIWDIQPEESPVLDQICLKGRNWHCNCVEFHDITDHHNTLIEEHRFISYHHSKVWNGNLLLARDFVSGNGLFLLKEAPCSDMQVGARTGDFVTKNGHFQVVGLGFDPLDILPDEWTRLYGSVMGVSGNDELSEALALRAYQKTARRQEDMVMMNTWGDRSQDGRVSEDFCLNELDKAARLGITVYQIDDGWQVGKSPASVVKGGSFDNIWSRAGYWDVDPVKFPHGLSPIVEKARRLGIEIGLWFNPSVQDDLADWEKDAAVLTGLWKQYGIRIFKIDGLILPTKTAERNLRKLLDRVREDTGDEVVFNMDVTNGRRIGYNWFSEYGNIFLENRYTDWGNYYPYKTLRNLWQLSRFVAPERFQIEFLNPWRNPNKYPAADPFAPGKYRFDYIVGTSLAAQPLAWMEASNLPEEAFTAGDLLRAWRSLAPALHAGTILPIGEEPSGRSWTGFQSIIDGQHGYLIVYRENTPSDRACLRTWLPADSRVQLKAVLGDAKSCRVRVDKEGRLPLTLKAPNSFTLYEYRLR